MTTANKITIIRILLVPFFVVQVLYYVDTGNHLHRLLALLSFGVAAVSDGIDGYLARHYNQKSELGAVLDPLADKLLLTSGILLLSMKNEPWLERIPLWMTGTIIGRDCLLVLGWAVIHFTCGKASVRPRVTGKIATVFQMVVVLWILLQWHGPTLGYLIIGTVAFTAVSGLLYVIDGLGQINRSPASGPLP